MACRLAESVAEVETLKERIVVLEQQNSELQATNQTLKDEHHALQLVYDKTEKNMKTIQVRPPQNRLQRCFTALPWMQPFSSVPCIVFT